MMEQLRRKNAQAKSIVLILGVVNSPLDLKKNLKEQKKDRLWDMID